MGLITPSDKAPTEVAIKEKNTLLDITENLKNKMKQMDDQYKDIPTPIDFAKLKNDVSHHNKIIYGVLISVIAIVIAVFIALLGGYFHFDNKIGDVGDHMSREFKELNSTHRQLENKINDEIKDVNNRIDSIIIPKNNFLNDNSDKKGE